MFQRLDPEFPMRMREWGKGLIVGGHNYGQGSSREHAALSAQYLGVQAVVAASSARIHRRNLIAVGIIPLELVDLADRSSATVGQLWEIHGIRKALESRKVTLAAETQSGDVALRLVLSESERAVLLAGRLLAHLRDGGRPRVQGTPES